MKQGLNEFKFIGHAGNDGEQIAVANGTLTKFSLAVSDGYKDKNGEWVDITDWFNVQCWFDFEVSKGDKVLAIGKVKTSKKDDKYYTNYVASQAFILQKQDKQEREEQEEQSNNSNYSNNQSEVTNAKLSDDVPF